jgi:hypothetical protein
MKLSGYVGIVCAVGQVREALKLLKMPWQGNKEHCRLNYQILANI